MEARVHKHLSSFLAQHALQDAVSNIDDIVLSYLLGILDLIGQGEMEDCFDLEDVTDMMNAYLPGFDQIDRSTVMDWMFNLAACLKEPDPIDVKEDESQEEEQVHEANVFPESKQNGDVNIQHKQSTFPHYDFDGSTDQREHANEGKCLNGKESKQEISLNDKTSDLLSTDDSSVVMASLSHPKEQDKVHGATTHGKEQKSDKEQKSSYCRRKKRYLSFSSQESQEDSSKSQVEVQTELDDCLVRKLLEMFPSACSMEAKHCLSVSNGDLNIAAQLIMDRQENDQAVTQSQAKSVTNCRKSKKVTDHQLDDNSIKSSLIEKYSFYDVAEDEKTHKPPPLKNEAKKLVRYRDGQIVSMKGERFSEIKKT